MKKYIYLESEVKTAELDLYSVAAVLVSRTQCICVPSYKIPMCDFGEKKKCDFGDFIC